MIGERICFKVVKILTLLSLIKIGSLMNVRSLVPQGSKNQTIIKYSFLIHEYQCQQNVLRKRVSIFPSRISIETLEMSRQIWTRLVINGSDNKEEIQAMKMLEIRHEEFHSMVSVFMSTENSSLELMSFNNRKGQQWPSYGCAMVWWSYDDRLVAGVIEHLEPKEMWTVSSNDLPEGNRTVSCISSLEKNDVLPFCVDYSKLYGKAYGTRFPNEWMMDGPIFPEIWQPSRYQ